MQILPLLIAKERLRCDLESKETDSVLLACLRWSDGPITIKPMSQFQLSSTVGHRTTQRERSLCRTASAFGAALAPRFPAAFRCDEPLLRMLLLAKADPKATAEDVGTVLMMAGTCGVGGMFLRCLGGSFGGVGASSWCCTCRTYTVWSFFQPSFLKNRTVTRLTEPGWVPAV